MLNIHTSLYFCNVLASLASQASTVALLLWSVVSLWVRSAGGKELRLLSWADQNRSKIRAGEKTSQGGNEKCLVI